MSSSAVQSLQAGNTASGELLPQLPNFDKNWSLDKYEIEQNLWRRKLLDYLRRLQNKTIQTIYQNPSSTDIPGTGTGTVNRWDHDSPVRAFNSGEFTSHIGSDYTDNCWCPNGLTTGGTKMYKISTPSGFPAPLGSGTWISTSADGAGDGTANNNWLLWANGEQAGLGGYSERATSTFIVDSSVDLGTLVLKFYLTTDGKFTYYLLNGNMTTINKAAEPTTPTRTLYTVNNAYLVHGPNQLNLRLAGDASLTNQKMKGVLIEWVDPTY